METLHWSSRSPIGVVVIALLLGLLGERLVLSRHLRLLLQRLQLTPELRQDVLQAQEVLVETGELFGDQQPLLRGGRLV